MRKSKALIAVMFIGIILSILGYATDYLGILLEVPDSGAWSNTNNVAFNYTPNYNSSIESCSLYINYELNQTHANVSPGKSDIFSAYLAEGYYLWNIECLANESNGSSEVRNLFVDTTPPNISAIAPANNATLHEQNISLRFSAEDNLAEKLNCTVLLDNEQLKITDSSDPKTIFFNNLLYGLHEWSVECADN
ncbi:hypothetical protein KY320_00925, partial [Candidatus Woesearchaeota archaeon]|nr:hypothetical protein [Candidatus Woesearchaeota archaeon]